MGGRRGGQRRIRLGNAQPRTGSRWPINGINRESFIIPAFSRIGVLDRKGNPDRFESFLDAKKLILVPLTTMGGTITICIEHPRTASRYRWQVCVLVLAFMSGVTGDRFFGATVGAADRDRYDTSSTTPQYVLLRNDHVLRGEVNVRGSLIAIRRGPNSELTLRSDQVFAIRDDLNSLFSVRQSMKRRRSQPSISELLDDARWCVDQQMPDQATSLLLQVYRVSPNHPVALQLEARLRRSAMSSFDQDSSVNVAKASFTSAQDLDEGRETGTELAETILSESVDVPNLNRTNAPKELQSFTTRVQPILMSRCGQCHGESSSREWKLVVPHGGTRVSQSGTLANLKSSLAFCQAGRPESSELFRMATTPHGESVNPVPTFSSSKTSPIAEHESRLIGTLQHWIQSLPDDPFVDHSSQPVSESMDSSVSVESPQPSSELTQAEPAEVMASLEPPPMAPSIPSIPADTDRPIRLPSVSDPDNVRHFNRETEIRRLFGFQ